MFEEPEKDNIMLLHVDVARGTGKDYSAFIILDVTTKCPFIEVVATYKNNEVKPFVFPNILIKACKAIIKHMY